MRAAQTATPQDEAAGDAAAEEDAATEEIGAEEEVEARGVPPRLSSAIPLG